MLAQEQGRDSAEVPGEGRADEVHVRMVNGTAGNHGLGPSGATDSMSLENPNLMDTVQLGDRPERGPVAPKAPYPPDPVEPRYVTPDLSAHVFTMNGGDTGALPGEPQRQQSPTSSRVRVQEFFTEQTAPDRRGEQHGVRWMARFSEFLRTTATRGASGVDRMLDGLGLNPIPVHPKMTSTVSSSTAMNVSPPEDFPTPPNQAPAIPSSWSVAASHQAPLFGPLQVAQMRQAQMDFPHIYGPTQGPSQLSEGESDRSSRLLAEVQRQLEEHQARQKGEMERLEKEVIRLREERDLERRLRLAGVAHDVPQSSYVPEGDRGMVNPRQSLVSEPPGLQRDVQLEAKDNGVFQSPVATCKGACLGGAAALQPGLMSVPKQGEAPTVMLGGIRYPPPPRTQVPREPEGNQGQLPQSSCVPEGNQGQLPQSSYVPRGNQDQLPQSSRVPEGNQDQLPQRSYVPRGNQDQLPQSSRVPEGNQDQLPQRSYVPGGNQDQLPQSSRVPGGNHGVLPQSSRVPGGHGPLPETGVGRQLEEGHSQTAQQWLGENGEKDRMALLADGITQLQEAMLKQYDKAREGDRSPQNIKPGTSILPTLKDVTAETSSVDIMDWFELIDAPMSDLSEGSAGWWRAVVKEAHRAYGVWTLASPVERLTVAPDVGELEAGQWSRVNSRAASMIVMALSDQVKQEVVARRHANSTTRLLYRLLQLYQPGGECEKVKILNNLQSPPAETDPQRAVQALRTWNRWLRRCRELGLQAPDPSLLTRGLNGLVRQVLEKHPEVSFRTSLLRSTLKVDTNPSYENVEGYYRHLMGECEALAVGVTTTSSTTTAVSKPEPRLKPVRSDPKQGTYAPNAAKAQPTTPTSPTSAVDSKRASSLGERRRAVFDAPSVPSLTRGRVWIKRTVVFYAEAKVTCRRSVRTILRSTPRLPPMEARPSTVRRDPRRHLLPHPLRPPRQ